MLSRLPAPAPSLARACRSPELAARRSSLATRTCAPRSPRGPALCARRSPHARSPAFRVFARRSGRINNFAYRPPSGLEIWRIENSRPVSFPKSLYGKFFTRDAYIVLATIASKSGALHHDVHYWLGKDTSQISMIIGLVNQNNQDEAGTAAIKTVELDAILGGRAVQYREVQGQETEKFLSYFKPCIIPQKGGVASGFRHDEVNSCENEAQLYVCKGKHVVYVKEVPFTRSSLNHDDVFLLDTKSKVFQFNGSNSSIQERAKALEVVQYIRETHHDGKCEVAVVDDGKLMADADAGEFWSLFGGFAPLHKRATSVAENVEEAFSAKLLCVHKGKTTTIETDLLTRELLESNKCYMIDCGVEVFVWMGRYTSLDDRKSASVVAEELVQDPDRQKTHLIRIIEGFETVMFQSKFDSWPETSNVAASEDGRGKVAALLKLQGLDVKGLMKSDPVKEKPEPCIDSSGVLQVWRIDGNEKALLSSSEQSKLYTGDCYVFHYTSPGEEGEEYLIGTWFGKKSVEPGSDTNWCENWSKDLQNRGKKKRRRKQEGKRTGKVGKLYFSVFNNLPFSSFSRALHTSCCYKKNNKIKTKNAELATNWQKRDNRLKAEKGSGSIIR
ncbi:Villin-4 [Dendrobium catenatum]|uniref:Villin-4 n=1 Tax=Dendrobium catenatum TaxID=906689 RepID=A0A2I0VHD1_9ASPA|nr:Villin-4 [Dendrobium catenatum]